MLEKTYDPAEIEKRHYARWEKEGLFEPRPASGSPPYSIVIPPPNVTGSLHMGHALNNTLQDVLIRWRRMKGDDTLWQPGTDHAGIATQMVVTRQLEEKGIALRLGQQPRANQTLIDRDEFLAKVWEWKAISGGTITGQLRRLGAACAWTRERFTMDEGLSAAVLKVFVDLYKQGLIYKDNRLVNWDPKMLTAISDLEVEPRDTKGHLWYFRYPIEGSDEHIVVATTRPETMLGDTGVAVHPDDPKWRHLIGKRAILPVAGRRIAIVADEYSDPEKGSGAVKITPAHDFNDFEVGRRHDLRAISVLDKFARLALKDNAAFLEGLPAEAAAHVLAEYHGLDRFDARKKIVAEMEALGLVEKIEPHAHTVPYGDRGGVPIEPFLTEQWYVNAKELAKEPIAAARDGRVAFVPARGRDEFFRWMEDIQPWCVSRQLWWGHQIPAWYGPDGKVFVEMSEAEAKAAAQAHYGKAVELTRDPDVLDTWFSSALWPFSTLGWPEATPELARYYPTSVLVTGWDILFFWVARMMMMGQHFMKEVPFRTVYVHSLVTDERGQKMSKSKGNVIDPLELIDKYGADALRFTMTSLAALGRPIKIAPQRVEGSRNFGTKLWNAARFGEMNGCVFDPAFDPASAKSTLNRWLVGELAACAAQVDAALEAFRFNEAANALYEFIWGTYCDWYLELAKPALAGEDAAATEETRKTAAWAVAQMVKLMHPVTPFLTAELHEKFVGSSTPLMLEKWPSLPASLVDEKAKAEMDWLVGLISGIRSARSELNVPAGAKLNLLARGASTDTQARLARHAAAIARLARVEGMDVGEGAIPSGCLQLAVGEATYALPVGDVVDLKAERTRLEKEIGKLEGEIGKIDAKLGNAQFMARAPEEVVDEQKERRAAAASAADRLRAAVKRLAA